MDAFFNVVYLIGWIIFESMLYMYRSLYVTCVINQIIKDVAIVESGYHSYPYAVDAQTATSTGMSILKNIPRHKYN